MTEVLKVVMAKSDDTKRLFLLDGMALTYRAHFALIRSPRFTSGGLCTSAVFGLANTLLNILNSEKPSHVAVVFDTDEPTHRHNDFPEYKAQRQAIPEHLSAQFPLVNRLFEAFRIATIRIPGCEADDIIGTLACQAERDGFTTWMVTPDKDLEQLVNRAHSGLQAGPAGLITRTAGGAGGARKMEDRARRAGHRHSGSDG
jgi:DNA polymerase-1